MQQHPGDFAAGTQMNVVAEDAGFIVIYPEQPESANLPSARNDAITLVTQFRPRLFSQLQMLT
ncbi:PHB depolymerase family esterase (plasmid) [Paraburkholderia sprentiae WSM5005]|uniref:PHB depolymerase family esterase n=1 Tax=Paraburkholderia sprentiae WSM5005 TaxID=754502 RepID=A0A8F4KIK9_9BURK|nr:PHB depolymerase family esterase [Paraburkholderia sprentiae WSM5005]